MLRLSRIARGGTIGATALAVCLALLNPAYAQTADEDLDQLLVDADALVIGLSATNRCALFDFTLTYLTPLEAVGAEIRLRQIEAALAPVVEGLPDQLAEMRAEANSVDCGNPGLAPFIGFSAQIAQDTIDIALVTWREVSIDRCSYFVDNDFLRAIDRAKIAAVDLALDADPARAAYIEEIAALWITLFNDNCFNLGFEPARTLPGQIALAIPTQQGN